jgi:hypothetical protein
VGYYRAPPYAKDYTKQVQFGYQCQGGTLVDKQTIWYDDIVVVPVAAC